MAKAERISPAGPTIRLELTEDEASAIMSLVGKVGASTYLTDPVYYALQKAGVQVTYTVQRNTSTGRGETTTLFLTKD